MVCNTLYYLTQPHKLWKNWNIPPVIKKIAHGLTTLNKPGNIPRYVVQVIEKENSFITISQ